MRIFRRHYGADVIPISTILAQAASTIASCLGRPCRDHEFPLEILQQLINQGPGIGREAEGKRCPGITPSWMTDPQAQPKPVQPPLDWDEEREFLPQSQLPPYAMHMMTTGGMPPPMGMFPPGMMPMYPPQMPPPFPVGGLPPIGVEDPFTMVESPERPVRGDAPTSYMGVAALEFNHPYVQNQFSTITVDLLFKPLMAAVGVMRKDLALACGRETPDADWLSFFSSCSARETSRVMKIISRLYVAAASGKVPQCHQLILDLAEEGLVTGSETRLATPVALRAADNANTRVDWHTLVGEMVNRTMLLMKVIQAAPAPITSVTNG